MQAVTRKEDEAIEVKGARVHNLKNISVSLPHNKLTVITGVSGSGKSSLAFDTIASCLHAPDKHSAMCAAAR